MQGSSRRRGEIVGDEPCPQCRENGGDRTGNHLIVFDNGNKYCNRCGYKELDESMEKTDISNQPSIDELKKYSSTEYRNTDAGILEELGVKTGLNTQTGEISDVYYPVYHIDGTHIGYKVRSLPKRFSTIGNIRKLPKQFFGQWTVGEGGKLLIIVEGEDDTLVGRQILKDMGKSYNIVGLPFGVSSAEQIVRDNINWLESFETIIVCTDQDDPGQEAAQTIASLLTQGKVKMAKHTEKDVCDLYESGKADEFLKAIWRSKIYTPRGIVSGKNYKDTFFSQKLGRAKIEYPDVFSGLSELTDHARAGELVVLTGGTGSGKSQVVDQMIHYWVTSGKRVGAIKMEHDVDRNIANILSTHIGINLKVPELAAQVSDEDLSKAYDDFHKDDGFYIIDHSVELSDSSIFDQIRYLAVSAKCDVIVIDHLHAIMYEEADENENSRMDSLLRKLWRYAQQYGVSIHAVAHPRKSTTGSKSAEQGGFISLDDLKGSSALKQVPDIIISIVRDSTAEFEEVRCTADLYVLKNRWLGHTGPAGSVIFDINTSNYSPVQNNSQEY